jgi:hypothetical protein
MERTNLEWIVQIEIDEEEEKKQRIRIVFNPLLENIILFGECKVKNNEWTIFSQDFHRMKITLEQLQDKMNIVVRDMRKRLEEYENLAKGFTVLKWVAFEEQS